jgi:MFS superfamily sulfate permease-like transporter
MQIKQGGVTAGDLNLKKYFLAKNLKKDIPAGLVVFLVALPLCLGIALASGAPLFSGFYPALLAV